MIILLAAGLGASMWLSPSPSDAALVTEHADNGPLRRVPRGAGDEPVPVEVELRVRGQEHTEVTGGGLSAGDRVVVGRREG